MKLKPKITAKKWNRFKNTRLNVDAITLACVGVLRKVWGSIVLLAHRFLLWLKLKHRIHFTFQLFVLVASLTHSAYDRKSDALIIRKCEKHIRLSSDWGVPSTFTIVHTKRNSQRIQRIPVSLRKFCGAQCQYVGKKNVYIVNNSSERPKRNPFKVISGTIFFPLLVFCESGSTCSLSANSVAQMKKTKWGKKSGIAFFRNSDRLAKHWVINGMAALSWLNMMWIRFFFFLWCAFIWQLFI